MDGKKYASRVFDGLSAYSIIPLYLQRYNMTCATIPELKHCNVPSVKPTTISVERVVEYARDVPPIPARLIVVYLVYETNQYLFVPIARDMKGHDSATLINCTERISGSIEGCFDKENA